MKYSKIIRQMAREKNISAKEIEKEMKQALMAAGINCLVKQFLEATKSAIKGLYIV